MRPAPVRRPDHPFLTCRFIPSVIFVSRTNSTRWRTPPALIPTESEPPPSSTRWFPNVQIRAPTGPSCTASYVPHTQVDGRQSELSMYSLSSPKHKTPFPARHTRLSGPVAGHVPRLNFYQTNIAAIRLRSSKPPRLHQQIPPYLSIQHLARSAFVRAPRSLLGAYIRRLRPRL